MGYHWHTTMSAPQLYEWIGPFTGDIWSVGGVSVEDVAAALDDGRLRDTNPIDGWQHGDHGTAEEHAERIAYLVTHGWDPDEPLSVTVTWNCDAWCGEVALEDGNHRLHALAYLGATGDVQVVVYGEIDILETVFEVSLHRLAY